MPILYDAAVEPDDLTVFVREAPVPLEFSLLSEFPTTTTDDNTVDFAEIIKTNRTARYRSFDGRVHVSKRDSASDSRVNLLPLSSALSRGEYERLKLEFARTGGTRQQALVRAAYNDAEQLVREVQARLLQAWGDVLVDGKLTIRENGYSGEADFGVPGNHLVAAGTAWTNTATATPLTNLQAWSDTYLATNGFRPARAKTSLKKLRELQRNKEVIDAVYGATQGRTRVSVAELNALLADDGLPVFDDPIETSVDVDGTPVRIYPEDKVSLLPPDLSQLGYLASGVSATALELVNSGNVDLSFEDAPGIVGVIFKEDGVPYREHTYVDATAMPVLGNARRLFTATV